MEEAVRTFKKIQEWEGGSAYPTYPQLEQLADKFKCPIAVFFFPEPPNIPSVEHSFRTLSHEEFEAIPRPVKYLLRKAQVMQINLSELNDGANPASKNLMKDMQVSVSDSISKMAASVREFLGVTVQQQVGWKNAEQALEKWRDAFVDRGIYVFKGAFRAPNVFGFCIYEEEFPIIYVNNTSAKARQIFTLFHELSHLVFRTSGIDTASEEVFNRMPSDKREIEVLCNNLAAQVLLPQKEFEVALAGMSPNRDAASELADYFCVSREVVYRRLLDMGLVSQQEYVDAASEWARQFRGSSSDSGNYYNSKFAYLGRRYVDLAFKRHQQRRFDDIQLAEYLDLKPKNLPTFAGMFGANY